MIFTYQNCIVDRIVDGDTVDLNIDLGFDVWLTRQRIRLFGIDCPETRSLDLSEKAHGLLAKSRVEELIPLNSKVKFYSYEYNPTDLYGRITGSIILSDGRILSDILESEFLAVKWSDDPQVRKSNHITNRKYLIERGLLGTDQS